MDLKRGIDLASAAVTAELKKLAKEISKPEEVEQVATISANSDVSIGKLIASAMAKVGTGGVITVTDGKTLENEVEIIEGMKFDQGYISRYFATDVKSQKCDLENVHFLLVDGKVSNVHSIIPALEYVNGTRDKLVIIAENIDGEALTTLIINKVRGLQVVAVKAPGFGDNRKNNLQDIAILTGAQVVSEDLGFNLENFEKSWLGSAKKVSISQDDTIILEGGGDQRKIVERCEQIKAQVEKNDVQLRERKVARETGQALERRGGFESRRSHGSGGERKEGSDK